MQLVFASPARMELDEARRFYDRQQAGLGLEFMREAQAAARRILEMPLAWQVEFEPVRRILLHRFPYKLIYAVRGQRVIVLAVAHQHREPEYWVERLSL